MDARNAEKVQGYFSSAVGHHTRSRSLKQFLWSLLGARCAQPLSGCLKSVASLLLPPPAPFSFEAQLSMSLVAFTLLFFSTLFLSRQSLVFPARVPER